MHPTSTINSINRTCRYCKDNSSGAPIFRTFYDITQKQLRIYVQNYALLFLFFVKIPPNIDSCLFAFPKSSPTQKTVFGNSNNETPQKLFGLYDAPLAPYFLHLEQTAIFTKTGNRQVLTSPLVTLYNTIQGNIAHEVSLFLLLYIRSCIYGKSVPLCWLARLYRR